MPAIEAAAPWINVYGFVRTVAKRVSRNSRTGWGDLETLALSSAPSQPVRISWQKGKVFEGTDSRSEKVFNRPVCPKTYPQLPEISTYPIKRGQGRIPLGLLLFYD
jgi:hypothetical protein